ncbi:MAG: hypothetical protein ABI625_20615 [bacterium]
MVKDVAGNTDAKIEVVMHGKGLQARAAGEVDGASGSHGGAPQSNLSFPVCEVALKNNKVEKGQLFSGVGTVPEGIYELVERQRDGWGYIKAVH